MANGNEYGLFQLMDRGILEPSTLLPAADSGLLSSAIEVSESQHNANIDAMLRIFVDDTTDFQEGITQMGATRNQPVDQHGRAIPIKPSAPYTVSFPLIGSGNAWGANFLTRQRMTVRMLANTMTMMFRGDYQWVMDHILSALYTNTTYSFVDPEGHGTLTIQSLANSDSVAYYLATTNATATDTHFLATASAIADATNPYPTIKTELLEHPDNQGEVIAFIPTNLVATTTALAEFRSALLDPDIRQASTATVLENSLGITLPLGAVVKGKTDSGVWIVEWPQLPSSYIVAIPTLGPRPLARRQFPEANLQGFRLFGTRSDFPHQEAQYQRWEGYGARSRIGAVVMRIGNGTYAIPSNFTAPLP